MSQVITPPSIADLFKSLVWDNFVKMAISDLLTALAISATGPLGWIITSVVTMFANKLFAAFAMFADISTIKLRNAIHQSQFDNASQMLGITLSEYGPNSKEFEDAHAKEQQAFYNLITIKVDPLGVNT